MSEFKAGDIVKFTELVSHYEDITLGKEYLLYESQTGCDQGLFILDDIAETNFFPRDYPEFTELAKPSNKRPHYDLRIAHANGADIECYRGDTNSWHTCECPSWFPDQQYRIAIPKVPERIFPVTSLSDEELVDIYCSTDGFFSVDKYRAIANAALRRQYEDM